MRAIWPLAACVAAAAAMSVNVPTSATFNIAKHSQLTFDVLNDRPVALWLFDTTPNTSTPLPSFTSGIYPSSTRSRDGFGNKHFRNYAGPLYVRGAPLYNVTVGPTFTGLVAGAIHLDGVAYLEAPYSLRLNPTNSESFSIEVWLRWTGGTDARQYIVSSSFACNPGSICTTVGYGLFLTTATQRVSVRWRRAASPLHSVESGARALSLATVTNRCGCCCTLLRCSLQSSMATRSAPSVLDRYPI